MQFEVFAETIGRALPSIASVAAGAPVSRRLPWRAIRDLVVVAVAPGPRQADESPPSSSTFSAGTNIMPDQLPWPWSVTRPMVASIMSSLTVR